LVSIRLHKGAESNPIVKSQGAKVCGPGLTSVLCETSNYPPILYDMRILPQCKALLADLNVGTDHEIRCEDQ